VVHGTLHVKSYRLLPFPAPQALSLTTFAQPAQVTFDADIPHTHPASLQEVDASIPNSAGLHSFRAVSDGVLVLDVIGPPYAGERPCRYYRESTTEEVVNLALPAIEGAARLGARRPGNSSDEEMWGERSSKAFRIGSSSGRKSGKGKRRWERKGTRETSPRSLDLVQNVDIWMQAQGLPPQRRMQFIPSPSPPAGELANDGTAASLPLQMPPSGTNLLSSETRWDVENSASTTASLEGHLNNWALSQGTASAYGMLYGTHAATDYSTRSLPDPTRIEEARSSFGTETDKGPHGRSVLGTSLSRTRGFAGIGRPAEFVTRANSRAMSRGASVGSIGPTAWAIGQGDVGACLWLLEDPNIEYDCIERDYLGQPVYWGPDGIENDGLGHEEVPVVHVALSTY